MVSVFLEWLAGSLSAFCRAPRAPQPAPRISGGPADFFKKILQGFAWRRYCPPRIGRPAGAAANPRPPGPRTRPPRSSPHRTPPSPPPPDSVPALLSAAPRRRAGEKLLHRSRPTSGGGLAARRPARGGDRAQGRTWGTELRGGAGGHRGPGRGFSPGRVGSGGGLGAGPRGAPILRVQSRAVAPPGGPGPPESSGGALPAAGPACRRRERVVQERWAGAGAAAGGAGARADWSSARESKL